MGSLRDLRVTRNLIPNFSSCLDKTRIIVVELRKSSSNFSILSKKFTSTIPPLLLEVCLQIRLHCRLRIHEPIATPPTNNTIPHHAQTLFPANSTNTAFFVELESAARFAARPAAEEARQSNSATERNESKLKFPPLTTTTSFLAVAWEES